MNCDVKGCARPRRARGLCTTHYQAQRRAQIERGGVAVVSQPAGGTRKLATTTHCANNHLLTEDNLSWVKGRAKPRCKTCLRESTAAFRERVGRA